MTRTIHTALTSAAVGMGAMTVALGCALGAAAEQPSLYTSVMTRLVVDTAIADEREEEEEEAGGNSCYLRVASAAEVEAARLLVVKVLQPNLAALAPSSHAVRVAAFAGGVASGACAVDDAITAMLKCAASEQNYRNAGVSWAPHV